MAEAIMRPLSGWKHAKNVYTKNGMLMQQVAPGKHQMAHYAFASGIMNLGVMLPGMMSGFVSDWLGYKYFFIVTLLAMIPSFLVAYFVPFTYDDKGNKLV